MYKQHTREGESNRSILERHTFQNGNFFYIKILHRINGSVRVNELK